MDLISIAYNIAADLIEEYNLDIDINRLALFIELSLVRHK